MKNDQQIRCFRPAMLLPIKGTTGFSGGVIRNISAVNARRMRRQIRRWLNANGLVLVLVGAMMVFAWMIAGR